MAFLNEKTNELHLKLVYVGGSGSGKTTNFQSIYKQTGADPSSKTFFDMKESAIRSHFFEFLPMSLGETQSHPLRLHLYTLPPHDVWESVLLNLLTGVDGVVQVVDSRMASLQENFRQLTRIQTMLRWVNRSFSEIPLVFQYNHRDAADALSIDALRQEFSRPAAPYMEAVATNDKGVFETLEAISERVIASLEVKNQIHAD